MTNNKIKTLNIIFNTKIEPYEISCFRGAVISLVKSQSDASILFHNHKNDGFRYSYPLIQYKRIHGYASLVCVGEGTEAIYELFSSMQHNIMLGARRVELSVANVYPSQTLLQTWNGEFSYQIRKWLPLNQRNFSKYNELTNMIDRLAFLESILTANILSMAKGLGVFFENKVVAHITNMKDTYSVEYKNVSMVAFDMEFVTNVSLPNYLGIGKGVSLGMGTISNYSKK